MWAANSKALGMELTKAVGAHIMTPNATNARNETIAFSVCTPESHSCFGTILPCYFSSLE
jgi:hypothetical protein